MPDPHADSFRQCPRCAGKGHIVRRLIGGGTEDAACPACRSTGYLPEDRAACDGCHATGRVTTGQGVRTCPYCKGRGTVSLLAAAMLEGV